VGMELRPRRVRAAAELWRTMTDRHGVHGRDRVWEHPDLLPSTDDLDDPAAFTERANAEPADLDDPIAALQRTERETPGNQPGGKRNDTETGTEQGRDDGNGDDQPEGR
jgi:Zincin-like metallopeptidase